MNISSRCILCLLSREKAGIRVCLDRYQKAEYLKDVMQIMLEADSADTMPRVSDRIHQPQPLVPKSLPDYAKIEAYSSTIPLEVEPMLENAIEQEIDPPSYALRLFRCGNYINFSAMDHVDKSILHSLLGQVEKEVLDASVYQHFLSQAADSSSVLSL